MVRLLLFPIRLFIGLLLLFLVMVVVTLLQTLLLVAMTISWACTDDSTRLASELNRVLNLLNGD